MLTFLHLSDIHFRRREGLPDQFDLDAQLRDSLLEDIKSKPAKTDYDGLLITGDIAFAGTKADYECAKAWLETVYSEAGVLPEHTYVVPGNHDVDRKMVVAGGAIWNNHSALRQTTDKIIRRDLLQTQLSKDPACDPLAPLTAFNEFAQGYRCRSRKEQLAWIENFPEPLNDGSTLRLHGLNSALTSNEGDSRGNLYVAPFQTQHFQHERGIIELVLCHHPPHWLLDMMDIDGALKSYAQVALFGHEHTHRSQIVNQTVQLFAGAVHPAARDPDWLPTYHILQLQIEGEGKARQLVVKIHSRELRALDHTFVRRTASNGNDFEEYKVNLTEWHPPAAPASVSLKSAISVSSGKEIAVSPSAKTTPTAAPSALRQLLVHFHRLSTPVRYKIAMELNLLRDGDDVPPQQQWDLVFERAQRENRLADLWAQIASKDSEFANRENPFNSKK